MKFVSSLLIACIILLTGDLLFSAQQASAAPKIVYFTDNYEVIHGNPYTGTAFDINKSGYTFTNDPEVTKFINGTEVIPADGDIVRVHIAWADFEPANNQWEWDRFDQFMSKINEQGKTAEVQLLMSESPDPTEAGFPHKYPPEWLFETAGCPYRWAPYGDTPHYSKQPIYYNSCYLDELEEAVNAFAERYDGNPGIAWVDLRAFSLFGEWSGWNDGQFFPWPDATTRTNTLRQIIDIYVNAFQETMVTMQNAGAHVNNSDPDANTQAKRYQAFAFDYAAAQPGWGFRSDTVNSSGNWMDYSTWSQAQWNNRKTRRDHLQASEGANWDNSLYMLNNPRKVVQNALEDYRSNLQGINNTGFEKWNDMKAAYGEWFTLLGRYSGYRFLLAKAQYNDKVAAGGEFALTQTWTNNGVGFLPRKYPLKVYFINPQNNEVVWSAVDQSFDQTRWFKGEYHDVKSSFTLPASLAAGNYDLYISMVDAAGEPKIKLPMDNENNKKYKIGSIAVAATADAYTAPALTSQFRVEGEDYTAAHGAYGTYYSPEGDHDSLYMEKNGNWVEYDNIDVPQSGMYTVEFRVSSEEANYFHLEVDGVNVTGAIKAPNSGGYLKFRTIERQVYLTEGRHTLKVVRGSIDRWFFLNWMKFTLNDAMEIKLQAENPSDSSGVWLNATEFTDNDGTPGVSIIDTGDWLEYENVYIPKSGNYLFEMRYSTLAGSSPQKYKLQVDGVDASSEFSLLDTGGVNNMRNQDEVVYLPEGNHTLRIVWTDAQSRTIWNWMKFSYQDEYVKTIEAEHYTMQWNLDKEDQWNGHNTAVTVEDFNDGGAVKAAVFRKKNDYTKYDNVYIPHNGHYFVEFRVASNAAHRFNFEVDGTVYPVDVPNTGGGYQFTTIHRWVKLSRGINNMRIVLDQTNSSSNLAINWLKITK
ncbi:carbohydrate-binding protein [Paenibacillus sp. IITD108]|uniref:carbohydrate-binding protein n=1 Tax=Paenibacillus sp. IITD108 TaxID=3116649 RepID=UPI002F3F9670